MIGLYNFVVCGSLAVFHNFRLVRRIFAVDRNKKTKEDNEYTHLCFTIALCL